MSSVSRPDLLTLTIMLLAPIGTVLAEAVPLEHPQVDQESGVTGSDFARFTTYYYEAGSPDLAPKMLRYTRLPRRNRVAAHDASDCGMSSASRELAGDDRGGFRSRSP